MLKRWIFFFFFVAACLSIPVEMKRFTRGFKIAKLRLAFPSQPSWDAPSALGLEEVRDILSQPFRYLNKGAQAYVFESQDGRYVLKLFRFSQRRVVIKKRSKRPFEEKVTRFFKGCVMAAEKATDETGLLYLHLNPTVSQLPILKAKNPMNQSFSLPLDSYRFALQKKAIPIKQGLLAAKEVGKLPERIEEIISLLERRIKKGIGNDDPALWRNFGFLETQAVEFDFGNYIPRPDFSEPQKVKFELERYMRHLRKWLEINAPDLLADFNARVERANLSLYSKTAS